MDQDILNYHAIQTREEKEICEILYSTINSVLPEAERKIWHRQPVWFLEGNPVVGYSKLKNGIRLLFWSGQSFEEPGLEPEGKFKAAEIRYSSADRVVIEDIQRWLEKAREIQWDYKNIVKRKGQLERLI